MILGNYILGEDKMKNITHTLQSGWEEFMTGYLSQDSDDSGLTDNFEGWRKAPYSLDSVLQRYPHIWLEDGYKLAGYQFRGGIGGNGFPFVIPNTEELPEPPKERMDFDWLKTLMSASSLPDWIEPNIAAVLQGDGTPLSYLEASFLLRELHEIGAYWHGINWGSHKPIFSKSTVHEVINTGESQREWKWESCMPKEWRPCFCVQSNGNYTVEFFSHSGLGQQAIYLHRDIYTKGYEFKTERTIIATGGCGYIF